MANQELLPLPQAKVEETDLSLAQSLKEWAEAEVISKRLEHNEDYEKLLYPAMKKLLLDIEMQKILWPEEYGGVGHNSPDVALTLAFALEQIGRADTGIGFICAASYALSSTIALKPNMNNTLCQALAPLFCRGDEPAIASLILPAYGREDSDPGSTFRGKYLQARARKDGEEYIVSGKGMRPANSGTDAALYGILCAVEGEAEPGFVIIPADSPGIQREEAFLKTGLAASRNCNLIFDEVRVPADNLVFMGEQRYRQMLSWFHMGVGAVTVGSLFAAYEIIKEWGDTRVIKGKGSIFKENPLTASLMAEVSHEILLSRLLTYQLAQMLARPEAYEKEGVERLYISSLSIAAHVTHAAEKALNNIMELMGSAGYATEWNLERYWRDVKTMQVHLGNWELNKMDIARYFYQCKTL